nr:cytochrome P450 6j1-like [Halyomorpha halys]
MCIPTLCLRLHNQTHVSSFKYYSQCFFFWFRGFTVILEPDGITYNLFEIIILNIFPETMRMYPTLPALNRSCTKDYTTPAGHKIKKGDNIIIPIWSLQRDSKYFPDPKKFDPERFSPKNKDKIKPFTYMPFGDGPRNCIGSRFGLLQTKVGIITILKNYEVHKTEETQIPLKFRGSTVIAMTKGPITLKFSPKPSAL